MIMDFNGIILGRMAFTVDLAILHKDVNGVLILIQLFFQAQSQSQDNEQDQSQSQTTIRNKLQRSINRPPDSRCVIEQ